ncbi:hypothetical protein [Caballeronia sp. GAWG1-1]|uniref:hypothetical protein n=1 Tax=Caballeronia sp. GAWG1-1 TaxID=2921742 RepID=UPI002027BCB7|nr:hypothetical protein [Caballeronia sp. GAWG1-1]
MEPMKPMKPMTPMQPMESMKPMEHWWPDNLGEPQTSGAQNGLRYAFFADAKRLLIEDNGTLKTYDSADHRISGVSQGSGAGHGPAFTSQNGVVDLTTLKEIK